MPEWFLASSSPRRLELLKRLGRPFRVIPPDADESLPPGLSPLQAAESLAVRKTESVALRLADGLVIAADTIVAARDAIIGKPRDRADAVAILKRLSSAPHVVVTGLCLLDVRTGRRRVASAQTRVTMRAMTGAEIEAYVDSGEAMGKAGAYAIQETGDRFVLHVEGSFSNVVGLPLELLEDMLKEFDPGDAERKMKNIRHAIFVIVVMAVVLGAMAVTFYLKGDLHALEMTLRTAHWGYAPLAILVGLLVYPIKAFRWSIILGPAQNTKYRTLLSAVMIGFMANCIISRVGELIRAIVMSVKGEMRTSAALASIALERLFDMCTFVLFFALALWWLPPSAGEENRKVLAMLHHGALWAAILLGAAVAFLVLLRLCPQWMTAALARFTRLLPAKIGGKIESFLATFLRGLDTLRTWRQVAAILLLSLVHWGVQVLFFLLAGWCFPEMAMTLPIALLVFAIVGFAVAAAPTPGYIGSYQAGVLLVGAVVWTANQRAAWEAYSWLAWLLNVPFVILVGFIFLWKENLSFSQLRTQAGQTDVSREPPSGGPNRSDSVQRAD